MQVVDHLIDHGGGSAEWASAGLSISWRRKKQSQVGTIDAGQRGNFWIGSDLYGDIITL